MPPNNHPSPGSKLSRRRFITVAGAAAAFPTFFPLTSRGRPQQPAPSKRITLAAVGCGWQGPNNTAAFLALNDCHVVAACDLDKNHLEQQVNTINKHYGNNDCKAYHDYREVMARDDIDAVMLAVPDHWHALVATEAAEP